jgi:ribose/xylose/arabinose/galactoside ABC-type transport system permease subunit
VGILGTIGNIISFAKLDSWYRTLVNAIIIVIALAGPGFIALVRSRGPRRKAEDV